MQQDFFPEYLPREERFEGMGDEWQRAAIFDVEKYLDYEGISRGRLRDAIKKLSEVSLVLKSFRDTGDVDISKIKRSHLISFFEVMRARDAIEYSRYDDAAQKKLKMALTVDSLDPSGFDSQGRDALFELYVAAKLWRVGLNPSIVIPGEFTHDIDASLGVWPFAVEVKRIKTKKPEVLIKGAAKQTAKFNGPGMIALDLSYNFWDSSSCKIFKFRDMREAADGLILSETSLLLERIRRWLHKSRVMGVVFHLEFVAFAEDLGRLVLIDIDYCAPLDYSCKTRELEVNRHKIGSMWAISRDY